MHSINDDLSKRPATAACDSGSGSDSLGAPSNLEGALFIENTADWRTESHTVYSNDFKLRIVELASQPDADVAKIARGNGVAHNLILKWLRIWQNEGGYHVACLRPSPHLQSFHCYLSRTHLNRQHQILVPGYTR